MENDETLDINLNFKEETKIPKMDKFIERDMEEAKLYKLENTSDRLIDSQSNLLYSTQRSSKGFLSNKVKTPRINKINEILSQELDIQGVKIFDLHLLNMGK